MNKQKFIELLNNPGDLKEINLQELDDMVDENPYFQAARVLEAKGHRLLKSKVAGRKTASAAIYSTNRILLKQFLAGDGTVVEKPVAAKPTPIEEKPRPATRPAEKPASQVPSPIPTPPATPSVSEPVLDEDSSGSSSIDQLIYSLQKDMKELEKSRARYIEVSRKIEEEEAVEKAVKKATKKTEEVSPKTPTEPKKTTESSAATPKAKPTSKTTSTKSTTASKAKATTEKKTTSSKKTTAKKTTTKSTKPKTSATKSSTAKKTTTKASTRKASPKTSAKKSTSRASKSSKTTESSKKDDHDGVNQHELIDQFIKNNPSFKPAADSGEQSDLAAESTSLPEDIGTEYLAEIFLNQGKKDKAIKIYNSLMLRFPEKKAYFAGRIKKIK